MEKESVTLSELKGLHLALGSKVRKRLKEFKQLWEMGAEASVLAELIFCILTPQSRAKLCWEAVENMRKKGLLSNGSRRAIVKELEKVRFKNKKAEFVVMAGEKFVKEGKVYLSSQIRRFRDPRDARDWLVRSVKGIGYKEASHFLRNIGFGERLAILDRHILKNLEALGVIEAIPLHLSKNKYLDIEERMTRFSDRIHIPMGHLDMLLWYRETGELFK